MLSVKNITGVPENVTISGLNTIIDTQFGTDVYQNIHFDEDDGSWSNFLASPSIVTGLNVIASTGGTDSYVLTYPNAISGYVTGALYMFKATVANTGAATLNINGLGAKDILTKDLQPLSTGDISANFVVTVIYNGTAFVLQETRANIDTANAKPLRFCSTNKGWLKIVNSFSSLEKIYHK